MDFWGLNPENVTKAHVDIQAKMVSFGYKKNPEHPEFGIE